VCGILGDGDGWALQVGAVDVLRFRGGEGLQTCMLLAETRDSTIHSGICEFSSRFLITFSE
jgi:hypothetical protein